MGSIVDGLHCIDKILLTNWSRVTHICVSRITNIGSDNGLSPGRRQAIIWTNAEILLIEPFGTNFSEIFMAIHTFTFKNMHLNMSSGKWRPFCLGLNVLRLNNTRSPCSVDSIPPPPKLILSPKSREASFASDSFLSYQLLINCHCRDLCKISKRFDKRNGCCGRTIFREIWV